MKWNVLHRTARYIGSMVGDLHRTLLYGGLFGYPAGQKCFFNRNILSLHKYDVYASGSVCVRAFVWEQQLTDITICSWFYFAFPIFVEYPIRFLTRLDMFLTLYLLYTSFPRIISLNLLIPLFFPTPIRGIALKQAYILTFICNHLFVK